MGSETRSAGFLKKIQGQDYPYYRPRVAAIPMEIPN